MKNNNYIHRISSGLSRMFVLSFVLNCIFITSTFGITTTVTCTGSSGSYNSGSVNSSGSKNDGNLTDIRTSNNRGWAEFDLSAIPAGANVSSVSVDFVTYSSTSSSATNNIYGFLGNAASISGSTLYNNCGSGSSFNASSWSANNTNVKSFNAAGIAFIEANAGGSVNIGFVRGSTNSYNIYGYPASSSNRPQLIITYTVPPPCSGSPTPGNTIASAASVCSGDAVTLSIQNAQTGTGLSYQWQYAPIASSSWSNFGSNSDNQSINPSVSKRYRCRVTCSGNGSTNSTPTDVLVIPCVDMSNGSTTTCGANFYDSGGISGNYSNNENLVHTFYPTAGNFIRLTFNSCNTESGWDYITIFNGPTATGAPIYGPASGVQNIPVLTSTHSSGALTVRFTSDGSVTRPGWDAVVSCISNPNCSGNPAASNALASISSACPSDNITLSLSTTYGTPGINFQWQSSSNASFSSPTNLGTLASQVVTQTSPTYYRCIISCSFGGSTISGSVLVTQNSFPNCYCNPGYSFGCSFPDQISNVTFAGINTNTGCGNSGSNPAPQIFTAPNPNIQRCSTYPLSVTTSGDLEGVSVWFDWNQNGIFELSERELHSFAGTNPATYTASITVPQNAVLGTTLMRVRCTYNALPPDDPCASVTYGEVENYYVTITSANAPLNPVATAINGPSTGVCAQDLTFSLAPGHAGSIQWMYSLTSGGPYTDIPGATGATIVLNASGPATFYVRARFSGSGCPLPADVQSPEFTLVVGSPVVNITSSNGGSFCRGVTTTLSTTASGPYTWSTGANTQSIDVTPMVNTLYTVSTGSGLCLGSGSFNVNIIGGPVATSAFTPTAIECPGATKSLNGTLVTGTPGAGYIASTIPFAPSSNSGTLVSLGDDQVSGAISLGFTFNFFGNNYNQVYISSNGFITFNNSSDNGCCSGDNIPTGGTPNNLIAYYWEDLNPGAGGTIRYTTTGSAPNRIFRISVVNVPHYPSGNNVTSQIKLYESTNIIEIHSASLPSDGGSHTQGIENSNGTQAFTLPGRNAANWSAANDGVRFAPDLGTVFNVDGPVTYSWTGTNGFSASTINATDIPEVTTTYTLTVADNSCSSSTQVVVEVHPQPTVEFYTGTPFCEGSPIEFFTDGTGAPTAPTAGTLTVNVSGTGFLDETTWQIRNAANAIIASGGPYGLGSTNSQVVSPTSGDYPITFTIETQGSFNDNVANYSLVCNFNNTTLTSGTAAGGTTFTSSPYSCGTTGGALVYNWTGPNGFTSTMEDPYIPSAAANQSGMYYVTITDGNGCTDQFNSDVTVNSNPEPVLLFSTEVSCAGFSDGSFQLYVNNGTPYYEFMEAGLGSNFTGYYNNLSEGWYSVSVTDLAGCQSVTPIDIYISTSPNIGPAISCPANISVGSDASICGAIVNYATPVGTDACPGESTVQTAGLPSGSAFPLGTTINTFVVTDALGLTATCSFTVTVVDDVAPIALCQNITVQLSAAGAVSITAAQIDNGSNDACGIASLSVSPSSFTCANVGSNAVVLTVTDVNGNVSTCNATVTVEDNVAPVALCQNITVQLSAAGAVSITAAQIDNGSSDACGIASMSVSPNSFSCSNVGANAVVLTVTDNNGNASTCSATVTVQDNVAPVALCQNITVQLSAAGGVSITAAQIDNGSNDACGIASMSVSPSSFTCANVGANAVVLTVTDVNGNVSTCNATVTVEDNVAPVALCQNITVQLSAAGGVSITAAQIDNGSSDACGIASITVSPNSFTCANVGANAVVLTVTDVNGNISTCNATVTVEDNVAPIALCQNITVQLSAAGGVSITAAQIDNGSNDACGIASLSVSPNSFTCSNVGSNAVVLTVTDVNGNVSTCNATVTVEDNVAPVALCQNITVQLSAAGVVSITAAQIDNGSNDACGIASLSVSPSSFTCSNVGANAVVLTVTDVNGNVSTCNAIVTVEDNVAPVALCQNITVQLSAAGVVSITAAQIDNGSSDACGIASLSVSPSSFTCANVGSNAVVLTVTDVNGNVSTCSATVTVEDNVAPIALCQNVTIYLDANGTASTTATAVDNGSNDACGIASIALSQTAFDCSHTGANAVVLTVTDVNGNVSTCNATVNVVDAIDPVITCPGPISVNNDPGVCGAVILYNVTASDNCSGQTINQTAGLTSGSVFPVGTTVNTFVVTDASGNTATCSFNVNITDNEPPTITNVPANFSACNPISWIAPTITDNCPGVQVTSSHVPGTVFPPGTTTVTYTATDAYNQQTSVSFDVTVIVPSVAADNITSNRDYNNICIGENITLTVNGGILGAGASWKWYTGSCGGTLVGTGASITVAPTSTRIYYVRAEGTCNNTACVQLQVVVSTGAPTQSPVYSVFPAYGAPGITDVISVNPVPGATFYQWFTNNGQINGVLFNGSISPVQTAVPTVNITFVLPQSNYQIRVFAGNACGRTGQSNNHIRGTVEAPTSLTGPTLACPGQTLSYTVSAVSGNNVTYNWQLIPASAGTISGTGLTRQVTFASGFTSAQLCVNGVSNFGLAGAPLCIVISSNAPSPGLVSGLSTPCQGSTHVYSIAAVTGATGYNWSTTIPGAVVSGNGLTATVTFPNSVFAGNVCVSSVSSCGISSPSCMAVVSGAPGVPGPISGPTQGICGASNVNYSLGTSDANSYSWSLPAGVTISGASNLNSVNLNFGAGFTSGTITVTANYDCGSANSSISVNGAPSTPVITPATICAGTTELYFASSTGASSYNWSISGDDYSSCTNPPTCSQQYVEWSAGGGTMSVTATNLCGTSAPFNLSTNCRISDTGNMETKVYPNPTTGLITVEFSSYAGGNYNLTVTDLSGRVVLVDEMKATSGLNRQDLDLSFTNKGLYMLYVKDASGKISVTKIAVE